MLGSRKLKFALVGGVCAMALASAAAAESRAFNVPAGDLQGALDSYARQAGVQLLYRVDLVSGVSTKGAQGLLSSDDALAMVLADTGLEIRRHPSGAVAIVQAGEGGRAPQSESAAGDGADGTVEALIVTAQKREEDIQDVPIAISAFSQEDLTTRQVAGGPDLMTQVPNFTFTKTNFSSYSIQIRGIGTQAVSATVDPAVAVAFNNTPFIRNRFFEQEFYDLARVEVLRGPQGTLYGRNATAGVVNIISAKPTFGYEAKASADVANYGSHRLEGMMNIPLIEDKVALRLAGAWTKRDGYVTNQLSGQPIDGRDLWSTRLSLRIEPTERFAANFVWEHFEEDDDRLRSGKQLCKKDVPTDVGGIPIPQEGGNDATPLSTYNQGCVPVSLYSDEAFQTPNGFALPFYGPLSQIGAPVNGGIDPYVSATQSRDLRVIESMRDPEYRATSDLAEIQLTYDLPNGLTVSSETGYNADVLFSSEDYNRFNTKPGAFNANAISRVDVLDENGVFCDPQIGCSDRLVLMDLSTAKSRQFSQELRLSSDFDGPFNFSLGANFLRYDTEDKYYVFINSLSLWAANASWTASDGPYNVTDDPYVMGVSDNLTCLRSRRSGDPSKAQPVNGCIYIDPNPIDSLNDLGHNYFLSRNPYRLISYAAFGEAYYNITPNLKLTAGLRWTVDKKHAPRIPSWLITAETYGYPTTDILRQEWREPTGRLAIDWQPDINFTDQTLIYVSYAHGYKAGGANPPPPAIASYGAFRELPDPLTQPREFDPEFVDAFELGTKNTLADGRLTLNANAFYYDYTGYQISQIVNRSAVNLNFDAEVWGVEFEADWRPFENLRLGLKGGYENSRVADGMKAIDLMDRTAGNPDWVVTKPFAAAPSNCILPVWLVTFGDRINVPNGGGGNPGPCVLAYMSHVDPVTGLPYVPNPTEFGFVPEQASPERWIDYPGFDPASAPNNGEGFFKDLSGNELPNAPHFTTTLTADYTLPLRNDWMLTLHTDLYRQSSAWTRIFNTDPYDRLKPYVNVNFAALLTNDPAGWTVMAYVKNVFDKDSITGAFLNTDDTGLTTNVFLTEPRLYGLRVSKAWTGEGSWGAVFSNHRPGTAYPFTVELGASADRQDAGSEVYTPAFAATFDTIEFPLSPEEDLDRGDGRDVKVTYRPPGAGWSVSAAARFGKANGTAGFYVVDDLPGGCLVRATFCALYPKYYVEHPGNYGTTSVTDTEEYNIVDFMVGRDFGIGAGSGDTSRIAAGMRHVELDSTSQGTLFGMTGFVMPAERILYGPVDFYRHVANFESSREFKGNGPLVTWEGTKSVFGDDQTGRAGVDWELTGGVLFGKQHTRFSADTDDRHSHYGYGFYYRGEGIPTITTTSSSPPARSKSATIPTASVGLGVSYAIGGIKLGGGYRWERYFDAIDGGITERQTYDRTIDGPYFKLSVGFGG